MSALRKGLDRLGRYLDTNQRWRFVRPLFEAVDSILYTKGTVTRTAPHVRDGMDLKRMMMFVVIALVPAIAMAMYNTGLQANLAIEGGAHALGGWRTDLLVAAGYSFDSSSVMACVVHGSLYFLPALVVTFVVGGAVEVVFATLRGHEINEGFFVTGFLFPLTLAPAVPLWQVAVGIAFGVVFGKEVFGGTGMNFLNPALLARAFLFFAYPAEISGNVWVAAQSSGGAKLDAITGASVLPQLQSANDHVPVEFLDAFWGTIPGSMGETSAFACLLGVAFLLVTRIASWRIIFGVFVGTAIAVLGIDYIGPQDNGLLHIGLHWHLVLGGWAFGTFFMATDPVSAPVCASAKFVYGLCIGVLLIVIRTLNPAYPEGVMLAILFMNVLAPLLDYVVVRKNILRRRRGYEG